MAAEMNDFFRAKIGKYVVEISKKAPWKYHCTCVHASFYKWSKKNLRSEQRCRHFKKALELFKKEQR